MAVDFFQRQDEARQRTTRFLVLFGLGIITLIGLIYGLAAFLFLSSGADPNQPPTLWDPSLFTAVAGGVVAVVIGGSLIKAAQLSSGGKAVALMLDGQEVLGTTTDLRERRLLNVVEEMAIAAGLPVPPVYILPEKSINAFAAGHSPGDVVVAVSEGALTYLTRDELQGVVGHEFSHILNGDVRLSLRIVTLVFGILAISQIGFILMHTMPTRRSSSDNKGGGNMFLLGLGLYLLGMGGAFFGWLIQAAVSRQREYLADASAVQFTRNPAGIAGALKKIGGLSDGSRIQNPRANEVSHMFLSDAFLGMRFTDLLATHPPLAQRILRLDPQFDGTYPEVTPVGVGVEEKKGPQRGRLPPIFHGLPQLPALASAAAAAESAVVHVGHLQPEHVTYAAALQADLPDVVREAAQQAFSARALIYCLLLDPRPEVRRTQLAQLQKDAAPRDYQETMRLMEPVSRLPDAARLPLVDQALPALRQMSPAQHQAFRNQVTGLIHADNQVSLYEYALHCVLSRYLDADYKGQHPAVRYQSAKQVAPQAATVLSFLAWEGHEDETGVQTAFSVGMNTFAGGDGQTYRLMSRQECQLPVFHAALQKLALAAPDLKRRIVAACAAAIQADHQVTVREGELLRAVCATLGCPMPPLVEEEGAPQAS